MGRPPLPIGESGTVRAEQRGDGRWRARAKYRDHDGVTRPVEATGDTENAARKALRARLRERAGGGGGGLTGRSTVGQAIEMHLARMAARVEAGERSPNTLRVYSQQWTGHLRPALGGWRLSEVTVGRTEPALPAIAADASPHVARLCRVVLSAAMGLAVRHGALGHNPVRDVESVPLPRRPAPVVIPAGRVVELLVALDADPRAVASDIPDVVLWMLATTERVGNAIAASWERIDLDAATADLGPIVLHRPGVGLMVEHEQNTKRRRRIVGLPPTAVAMLRGRRERYGVSPTGLVFPNRTDTAPRDPAHVGTMIRESLTRAGFEGMTSHVLRRTGATALDVSGVTSAEIASQLGHTDDRITRAHYIAPRQVLPAVTAALEALIVRPAPVADLDAARRAREA